MSWYYALVIWIVTNTSSVFLSKIIADKISKKSAIIFYQFLFCALMATSYALFLKEISFELIAISVALVGFINAFANYVFLKAIALSLSKTVLMFPLNDVLAMALAVIFIGEASIWTPQLFLGVSFCFLAIFLFQFQPERQAVKNASNKKWFFLILTIIILYGSMMFLMKLFSADVSRGAFLMWWYVGSLLGSLPLLRLEKQNPTKIPAKTIILLLVLAIFVFCSLLVFYLTFQLGAPLSIVLPVRRTFTNIFPVMIGWFIFKERQTLSRKELFGFSIAILGVVLILLGSSSE